MCVCTWFWQCLVKVLLLTSQYSFFSTDYLAHRCNKDVFGETAICSGVREVAR